ncbi:hypothetical protein KAFR_0A00760 [Kazachstania africana CBS 2517]|uniref:Aminotransferase class I/classII large domain-containing protein n=1 Tax=Kazachstania africana (strain ATCC 22294 / BCRC 22015 / CBS 2517 / CECT 1963 / NBRC 1671 / NRRL Y-8276) TaxID=1071382 RepID=H2AMB4_KAZAF|nr:hypothetical protein KAFR_0A00760 [Kazachstania africana CBS 2517]CCF55514.1 hypothetical protein KAFR_0A00760 [Kazachstania africana CBS 2517]
MLLHFRFPLRQLRCFHTELSRIPLTNDLFELQYLRYQNDRNSRKISLMWDYERDIWARFGRKPIIRRAAETLKEMRARKPTDLYYISKTLPYFKENVLSLLYSQGCSMSGGPGLVQDENIAFLRTEGAIGAFAITSQFLSKYLNVRTMWIPDLYDSTTIEVLQNNGLTSIKKYPYLSETSAFNVDVENWFMTLQKNLNSKENNQVQAILLNGCAHKPSGINASKEDWKKVAEVVAKLKLIPILDMSQHGMESGSLQKDAYALRALLDVIKQDPDAFPNGVYVCHSLSSSIGFDSDIVGSLSVPLPRSCTISAKGNINEVLQNCFDSMYNLPAAEEFYLANLILSRSNLKYKWYKELECLMISLNSVRKQLSSALQDKAKFNFAKHCGLFYNTRLDQDQIERLRREYSVYLHPSGRMSLAPFTDSNIGFICRALNSVK